MAQADYSIANQGFPATRADINSHLEAIATNNSGTSAPSTQYAGQFWLDTTSSNWVLYIHDGADDIQFATIDTSANTVNFIDSELGDNSVTTAKIADGNVTSAKLSYPLTTFSSTGIDDNATSTAITIDSSERVGIGTASPSDILHIVSTDATTVLQRTTDVGNNSTLSASEFKNSDSTVSAIANFNKSGSTKNSGADGYEFRLSNFGNGYTSFFNDGSESMRIDSSGNVGIGTSSPDSILHIDGTNPKITVGTSGSNVTYLQRVSDDFYIFNRESAGHLLFGTNDTERMRIDSDGNVTINDTSTGYELSVGTDAENAGILLSNASAGIGQVRILKSYSGTTSAVVFRYSGGASTVTVGSITYTDTSTAYNTSSDYRLKENVNYDFDATTRLKQLKPARFNFITDADTTVDGFLAHEVSDVVPEAISGEKDAVDENGNPEYQGIDQSKLVPLLVKTIQELEARITTLENA